MRGLDDLSFADTASLSDANCYFTYGMLARSSSIRGLDCGGTHAGNARADENVVCSQRPKRRPVHFEYSK